MVNEIYDPVWSHHLHKKKQATVKLEGKHPFREMGGGTFLLIKSLKLKHIPIRVHHKIYIWMELFFHPSSDEKILYSQNLGSVGPKMRHVRALEVASHLLHNQGTLSCLIFGSNKVMESARWCLKGTWMDEMIYGYGHIISSFRSHLDSHHLDYIYPLSPDFDASGFLHLNIGEKGVPGKF